MATDNPNMWWVDVAQTLDPRIVDQLPLGCFARAVSREADVSVNGIVTKVFVVVRLHSLSCSGMARLGPRLAQPASIPATSTPTTQVIPIVHMIWASGSALDHWSHA